MPAATSAPETVLLHVGGLHYASEKAVVERVLAGRPGVVSVEANPVAQTATVVYDPRATSVERLREWVRDCGYHCAGQSAPGHVCDPLVAPDHGPHDHAAAQRADHAHGHGHGGHAGMSMDAMARDMRNRFLVALAFTVPVVLWSNVGTNLLGSEVATRSGSTATSGSCCSACRSSSTPRRSSSAARAPSRSGRLSLVASFFALALGIGAIVIALANGSDNAGMMGNGAAVIAQQTTGMMGSGTAGGMTMGVGGHGRLTSAMVSAAAHGKVYVQLGDYWAAPTVPAVRAREVTLIASNVGQVPHELMVERMPLKFDSPMHPNEDAAQGMIEDMDPSKGGRMTIRLKPGT